MREYHGGSRHREYFPHNVVRDVGQVDQHPDSVHLVDDCLSIITKCMITTEEPEFGFSLRIIQLFSLTRNLLLDCSALTEQSGSRLASPRLFSSAHNTMRKSYFRLIRY